MINQYTYNEASIPTMFSFYHLARLLIPLYVPRSPTYLGT